MKESKNSKVIVMKKRKNLQAEEILLLAKQNEKPF
jgi:hypothetical protein